MRFPKLSRAESIQARGGACAWRLFFAPVGAQGPPMLAAQQPGVHKLSFLLFYAISKGFKGVLRAELPQLSNVSDGAGGTHTHTHTHTTHTRIGLFRHAGPLL